MVALARDTEALSPAELNAQLASRAFRLLLAFGDEALLRRLLRPDTASVLFGALEYELPGRSCAQTKRYHTHHRAHLAAPGRFKEPVV